MRNRELRILLLALLLLSLALAAVGYLVSPLTGALVAISAACLCAVFLVFTTHRYRAIRSLSTYLRRISAGEYSLDIRDNVEGELSILKSEIYKVTLMLSEYNGQLRREQLLLSERLADISHQLKTPLTSMLMMVDLLRDEQLPAEKRREFTTHLHTQLERIEWLVASLLKMSRLDAGVVELKRTRVSGKELLDVSLQPLLIPLELKGITCSVAGEEQSLYCDLHWTAEAVLNVLKNCVEHTPSAGTIEIAVQDNPLYSEVRIADSGSGIDPKDLPHVFTRFYRGKNASSDSIGIGLAMSKSIMQNQQGDITVESRPGQGSTFHLRLYKSVL